MPYATTTLGSTGFPNNSSALSVSWRSGKPFTVQVTQTSSTATGDFTIQYVLADVTSSAYNPGLGGLPIPVSPTWYNVTEYMFGGGAGVSSSPISSAGYPAIHFNSSTVFPDGVVWMSNAPVAGVRLNSSAGSSGSLVLTLLQGDGW